MGEHYVKAVKWFALMLLVIGGSWAFFAASMNNDARPVMIGVIAYGFVFIFGTMWKVFRDKILLWTLVIIVSSAFATRYLPFYLYQYTGYYIDLHYVVLWTAIVFFPGIPIMAGAFKKYDK